MINNLISQIKKTVNYQYGLRDMNDSKFKCFIYIKSYTYASQKKSNFFNKKNSYNLLFNTL